jgi:glycosyltransferase involved in cell wall biosynthesis
MKTKSNRILYFADVEPGGLAEYAIQQAAAIQRAGAKVTVLGLEHLRQKVESMCCEIRFLPLHDRPRARVSWINALRTIGVKRQRTIELRRLIEVEDFKYVLQTAYSEYFSPLWVPLLKQRLREDVWFGVILHDPVRDFRMGPRIWHHYTIKKAYSYIDRVYTHGICEIETGLRIPPPVTYIPHGPYRYPVADDLISKADLKKQFGIPEKAQVLLSFGHIRDSKHLALMIESLAFLPNHHLLVAGREQSSGQKPAAWYQQLAGQFGVQDRCHWHNEFIPATDVWRYFRAADLLSLLYKPSFRSASGVLSANVQFALPVIASGGEGPLKQNIRDYGLGMWLDAPSVASVCKAINDMSKLDLPADIWARFDRDNSWERNANLILESLAK